MARRKEQSILYRYNVLTYTYCSAVQTGAQVTTNVYYISRFHTLCFMGQRLQMLECVVVILRYKIFTCGWLFSQGIRHANFIQHFTALRIQGDLFSPFGWIRHLKFGAQPLSITPVLFKMESALQLYSV